MIFDPLVHIRTGCLISFSGQYDFSRSASISRHKNFTAGKTAHTDSAMIAAAGTGPVFRFHMERFYFRSTRQGRSMLFSELIFGFKRHSIGTHEARNIRTDDFLSRQTFKSAEYRVIIKGTAFRHDMIPQLFSRLQLNDAEERIFDHRYGKRRRKICQSHTAVLHLFHIRIHNNRTVPSQIGHLLCQCRLPCKFLNIHVKMICKRFQKRTAAGGADSI